MKSAKKIISIAIIITIFMSFFNGFSVKASYKLPFEVNSDAVYLVNTDTGTVVYEKNADKKIYPASLTKIMTAIIAIETIPDLEGTVITAPAYLYDEFYGMNVSNADIKQFEEVRMLDLLYAMMLQSACEASSIIADHIGDGNISDFVDLMNKKAQEIGATDTVFKNPHGLFDEGQVTTAKDMYLITKYALTLPIFEKISTTATYSMPATNKHSEPRFVIHTNLMLSKSRGGEYYYENIKGIKTGSLPEVGRNLISMASFDGYNYLLITMGAPTADAKGVALPYNGSYLDAKKLYKWAFSSFSLEKVLEVDQDIAEVPVALSAGQDYITLISKNDVTQLIPNDVDTTTIQKVKTLAKDVKAPVKKGDVLGKLDLKLKDEVIATVDLVASQDIDRSEYLYVLDITKRFLSTPFVRSMLIILGLLILIYLVLRARYKKIKRMKEARNRFTMRNS